MKYVVCHECYEHEDELQDSCYRDKRRHFKRNVNQRSNCCRQHTTWEHDFVGRVAMQAVLNRRFQHRTIISVSLIMSFSLLFQSLMSLGKED